MTIDIKRIAINTGGGDAPGLNAVIHAAVYAARAIGWEILGIREGYDGLLEPRNYPEGGLVQLTPETVQHIAHLGGTILGTTIRGNPFKHVVTQPDGTTRELDRSTTVLEAFHTISRRWRLTSSGRPRGGGPTPSSWRRKARSRSVRERSGFDVPLRGHPMRMRVTGAAGGEVTGSAYLVQMKQASVLVDCGMFQGGRAAEAKSRPPTRPNTRLDAVVVTHGHLDHTGRLPLLPKQGDVIEV